MKQHQLQQLHVISTGRQPLHSFCKIAGQIAPYVTAFHLRERSVTSLELLRACEQLVSEGVSPRSIIINDRADVAVAAGVKGVQLAWHSMPVDAVKRSFSRLMIGKSVHSCEEARQAEQAGSDYVIFGHVFATASKATAPPRGIEALRQTASSVQIPVIAIGGILPKHVSAIAHAGAAGIAVMSGILEAGDSLAAVKAYAAAMQSASEQAAERDPNEQAAECDANEQDRDF